MKDLKRFLSYMGKNSFTYWFILIATLIIESFLQILYSYVTKRIINAIEFQNIELFRTAVIASVIIVILKCLFPYLLGVGKDCDGCFRYYYDVFL